VGSGLYRSLFGILSAQGFMNAYAGIALPNPASVGLHESVGFRSVGVYRSVGYKLGAWHDVGWWERGLNDHRHSPSDPIDVTAMPARSNWDTLLNTGFSMIRSGSE
jgi:phosphinothricin acetyltransferase